MSPFLGHRTDMVGLADDVRSGGQSGARATHPEVTTVIEIQLPGVHWGNSGPTASLRVLHLRLM